MAGDRRLRQSQAVVDVADAHLVVSQKGEDAQACLVGQRLEEVLDLVDCGASFQNPSAVHIFALTNVSRGTYIRKDEYVRSAQWTQSRKPFSGSTARQRCRPGAARRQDVDADRRVERTRSHPISMTKRRPPVCRRRPCWHRWDAGTQLPWRS